MGDLDLDGLTLVAVVVLSAALDKFVARKHHGSPRADLGVLATVCAL